jgi:membrane protease subunit (stomatin/prohibitin family)
MGMGMGMGMGIGMGMGMGMGMGIGMRQGRRESREQASQHASGVRADLISRSLLAIFCSNCNFNCSNSINRAARPADSF